MYIYVYNNHILYLFNLSHSITFRKEGARATQPLENILCGESL